MARTKTLWVVDKHHKAFCIFGTHFGSSRYCPKPPTHTTAGRQVFYKPVNHESNIIYFNDVSSCYIGKVNESIK